MKRCPESLAIWKCKLKAQGDLTAHLIEWLNLRSLTMLKKKKRRKKEKEKERLTTDWECRGTNTGGNVTCYKHFGPQSDSSLKSYNEIYILGAQWNSLIREKRKSGNSRFKKAIV